MSFQVLVTQLIKSEVLLVKPGFILVLLKGHAKGALAYLPAIRVSVCVCV